MRNKESHTFSSRLQTLSSSSLEIILAEIKVGYFIPALAEASIFCALACHRRHILLVCCSSNSHDNCPGFYGLRRPVFHSGYMTAQKPNPAFMSHQNIGCATIAVLELGLNETRSPACCQVVRESSKHN